MHDTPGGDGGFPHTFPHTLLSLGSRRCMAHRRKPVLLLALVRIRERLGSGGPRGLQILRSGVESVRGGFDSHAFPPLVARPQRPGVARAAGGAFLALAACALLAGPPARAQSAAPAETLRAGRASRTPGPVRRPPSRF